MAAPFTCRNVSPLPPAPPGWHAVSYAPLQDGSIACLQSTSDIAGIERRNRRLVEQGQYGRQQPYFSLNDRGRLTTSGDAEPAAEFPLEYPFPCFDRLVDGDWIVVSARCRPGDLNARRLTSRGELAARFAVGDAVERVQADAAGGVWVSYFDEGMADELGSAGIAHFDASGRRMWRANSDEAVLPVVFDCYASNAVGDAIWACYYSDFPIVRVRRSSDVRVWSNELGGATAIAVDRDRVVLFGGYEGDSQRIALLQLGSDAARWIGGLQLSDLVVGRDQAFGRGDTIHIIGRDAWRRFTVAEIAAAVAG